MSDRTWNCVIVDDHEIDMLTTLSYVKRYGFLQVKGVYETAETAIADMDNTQPEVLFLDVDMPGISGLELRQQFLHIPVCIFITSYPEYALSSFEAAALDFIVKPISSPRFDAAMQRLEEYLELCHKSNLFDHSLAGDAIFIKDGHTQIKIKQQDVLYLEALKDYTSVVTPRKKYCVLASLGNLLKEKSFQSFVRVHRSYAVQKHFVNKVTTQEVMVNDVKIPVGRSYKDALHQLMK